MNGRMDEDGAEITPHAGADQCMDEKRANRVRRGRPSGKTASQSALDASVAASRRGQHLVAFARSAGRMKSTNRRLLPHEYTARRYSRDPEKVQAVVLLLAHDGVARPDVWLALLTDARIALLVHSEVDLPLGLAPFRFPIPLVTAWEDMVLFVLMRQMLAMALRTYPKAVYFYTCPGNGVPIAPVEAILDPRLRQPQLPLGASLLGIPAVDMRPMIPAWERVRNDALLARGLPQMPPRCYGSMWMGLVRADAEVVVVFGVEHHDALSGAYRAAYAHAVDGHSKSHARLHPDEEFVPYIIHVLAGRPWPVHDLLCIMAEKQVSENKCTQCHYRAGHGAMLSERDEKRCMLDAKRLFMRKVE